MGCVQAVACILIQGSCGLPVPVDTHQSVSDTPGASRTGGLGAVSLSGPVAARLTPSSWSFLSLSCEVVWVAWDREAGRGLGMDKTTSQLLFHLGNMLIGLYFKFCVLG